MWLACTPWSYGARIPVFCSFCWLPRQRGLTMTDHLWLSPLNTCGASVLFPYCYLFLLSVFILWFTYYVSDIFQLSLGSWMTTCLGKSCEFDLPRVPFVNCCQFMYLVLSLLVLRAGYGIWLYQFLIIAYHFTLLPSTTSRTWLWSV